MLRLRKILCIILAGAAVSFSAVSAGAANMLMGDVNYDGKVSLRDATLAQKIEIGLVTALDDQKYVGDMDKNGSITVADAYLIQRLATRDPEVMEGNASSGIPAFCPNRASREKFYEALNEERAAQGLSALTYTEGMLAAGQELCDAWYAEYTDPDFSEEDGFSGYRNVISQYGVPKRFPTVFSDYGITGYTSGALIDASYGKSRNGRTYFSSIKTNVNKQGENSAYYDIYNDLLMKPDLTAVCIGQVNYGSSSACWIITGF